MRFRYGEWDEELFNRLKQFKDLFSLFNYLVLQTSGDVDTALEYMRYLQQQGLISYDYDLDEFERKLKEDEVIRIDRGQRKLTRKGERKIRADSLNMIFSSLRKGGVGEHRTPYEGGASPELLPETKPYQFGDNPRQIDFNVSISNAIKRKGLAEICLGEEDLEVHETENLTSCATVLLLDVSHSMVLYGEDRITPAKQVALALSELVLTQYSKDSLNVVLFGDEAWEVKIKDLPYVGAGPYYTNTKAGLEMARRILARKRHPNKQIFMITDGKPSVVRRSNGQLYRNPLGLDPIIVNLTLNEAVVCRKRRIPITTFMVTSDPYLQRFVRRLTELNKGRAYFTPPGAVGGYLFWDFIANRRRRVR
ncbi:MAG: VWA domain-containing protein [bacterium]